MCDKCRHDSHSLVWVVRSASEGARTGHAGELTVERKLTECTCAPPIAYT